MHRPRSRSIAALAAGCLTILALCLTFGSVSASAVPTASAATGRIEPGVRILTAGRSCTANFVFTNRRGDRFVGYAAHCAGRRTTVGQNGCRAASVPLGTRVRFQWGATTIGRGTLVYSSWRAMRSAKIADGRCAVNDFALVRVDRSHRSSVTATAPHWGGPRSVAALPTGPASLFGYAANRTVGGAFPSATTPRVEATSGSGPWTATLRQPWAMGRDSGAGYLDEQGRAVGVLIAPNRVASLQRQLAFARRHGMPGLRLVPGRAFTTSAVL